jgi:hypothetical protein
VVTGRPASFVLSVVVFTLGPRGGARVSQGILLHADDGRKCPGQGTSAPDGVPVPRRGYWNLDAIALHFVKKVLYNRVYSEYNTINLTLLPMCCSRNDESNASCSLCDACYDDVPYLPARPLYLRQELLTPAQLASRPRPMARLFVWPA